MQWVFCGLEKKNSPRCVNICPSIHNLWNTSRDGIFFSGQRIIQQLVSFCHVTFWSSQLPWNPGLINLWTCKIFYIKHQSNNKPKFVQHACSYLVLLISKAWNLYASLCFESDGFGWNIKIPSSLRGERLSQIVAPFLWHCYCWELPLTLLLLAATVPVSDRPTATASCNSIAVQHFRASLWLLFLFIFFPYFLLSVNQWTLLHLTVVNLCCMSIQSVVCTYNVLSKDML